METESNVCQSSPKNPWPESERTEEETIHCLPGESKCILCILTTANVTCNQGVSRVLHLFEFQQNGSLVTLPVGRPKAAYKDITAVGIVGTLTGKAGLFSQCCWFGNYDLDWFWCCVTNIKSAEFKADIRFRAG